ncbi:MAG TPA: glycosyltransferase family 2 protein [Acidobacteriota bacterium]|nr:glycosyltransferase family 2 protein [Acidobacteriota bacterium]
MKPLVTVLVCTYNDENTIGTVLRAITNLAYKPLEVLVINDASTDRTREIVEQFQVLAVHNPANRGLGYNQNLGLELAKGDCLALVQSDCEVLGADWLDRMAELMTGNTAVVVSQRQIDGFASLPAGARLFNAVAPQDLLNTTAAPVELQYCRGKADLYRTDALRELGGWSRSFFTAGEDTDLSIRLRRCGYRIVLHPTASVRYLFSGRQVSVRGALLKAYLYGKTAFPLYHRHAYDGIQARTYVVLLLSAALLPLPFPGNAVAGAALLVYSLTCRIQSSGTHSVPYAVLAFIASAPLLVLSFFIQRPELAAVPLLALTVAGTAYTLYLAGKNTARNYRKGERAGRLPGTLLFCVSWRLLSGVGYLAGAWESLWKKMPKKKPLENHESHSRQST